MVTRPLDTSLSAIDSAHCITAARSVTDCLSHAARQSRMSPAAPSSRSLLRFRHCTISVLIGRGDSVASPTIMSELIQCQNAVPLTMLPYSPSSSRIPFTYAALRPSPVSWSPRFIPSTAT